MSKLQGEEREQQVHQGAGSMADPLGRALRIAALAVYIGGRAVAPKDAVARQSESDQHQQKRASARVTGRPFSEPAR